MGAGLVLLAANGSKVSCVGFLKMARLENFKADSIL